MLALAEENGYSILVLALVVPLFENGDCVLIQQFRYPAQQLFWEVPAGKIDRGEDPFYYGQQRIGGRNRLSR